MTLLDVILLNIAFLVVMSLITTAWQTGYDWWVGNRKEGITDPSGGARTFWTTVLLIFAALFLANCVYAISLKL